jgi:broad specificity phosphatase PhoE
MRKTLDLPGKAIVDARVIEYGGDVEGYTRFFARVASFLEEVKTIEHDILVVTHGHVLQAVLTLHYSSQSCGCRILLPSPAETRNGGVCVFSGGKLRYWNA